MNIKKVIGLSLAFLFLNANAQDTENKGQLAIECHVLAENVASLVFDQQKEGCSEKLAIASIRIAAAGHLILSDDYTVAKQGLDGATLALQFAELNNCNRYIQISHSKFEAQRIKNAI